MELELSGKNLGGRKMKKLISIALACVLVLGLFSGCGGSEKGSVYYLNFKPEADQAWQDLAAKYTEQTGVEVKIVTAASGTYGDTLTAEMAKSDAPTLFQCGNAQELESWDEYCMDLSDTSFVKELSTDEFNMYNDEGALKCVGYCYEAFGIITNKALLAKAGYKVEDIKNFETLKAIAEDIHARADELGFDAFSSAGLDPSSSWRFSGHLINMPLFYEYRDHNITKQPATITGEYLDNFRNVWDMYINNSAADPSSLTTSTGDESSGEFKAGKAVFYQNGTWEFAGLVDAGMNPDDLTMIPIYCGVEGEENSGLCCGTGNYWCINAKASKADIQATEDFLYWVVTSDEGTQMLAEQLGPIPFKNAKLSPNVFFNDAAAYTEAGNYNVSWATNDTPNVDSFRATLVTALAEYAADQTDANWQKVVTAVVDGWATEYAVEHG